MANLIPNLIGTETALTCTLASLASSTVGVGRQSTIVDLRSSLLVPAAIDIIFSIKLGTTPVAPANIYFYLIAVGTGGTTVRTDSAGASDAGLTRVGAPLVWTAPIKASPATGDVIAGQFTIDKPPPLFGLLVVQDTGVNLDATGGNHYLAYNTASPQVQ